uniref:Uncharacterized protein n=1 Tax=Arundo donax TaxID=35708 RepID=A0A0A9BBL2_ARUDO
MVLLSKLLPNSHLKDKWYRNMRLACTQLIMMDFPATSHPPLRHARCDCGFQERMGGVKSRFTQLNLS